MFFSTDLLTRNGQFFLIWKLSTCDDTNSRTLRKYREQILTNDLVRQNHALRDMFPARGRRTSLSLRLSSILLNGVSINLELKAKELLQRCYDNLKKRRHVMTIDTNPAGGARVNIDMDFGHVEMEFGVIPEVDEVNKAPSLRSESPSPPGGASRHQLIEPPPITTQDLLEQDLPIPSQEEIEEFLNGNPFDDQRQEMETDDPPFITVTEPQAQDQQEAEMETDGPSVTEPQDQQEAGNVLPTPPRIAVVLPTPPRIAVEDEDIIQHLVQEENLDQNLVQVNVDQPANDEAPAILNPKKRKKTTTKPKRLLKKLKVDLVMTISSETLKAGIQNSEDILRCATSLEERVQLDRATFNPTQLDRKLLNNMGAFCKLELRNEAFSNPRNEDFEHEQEPEMERELGQQGHVEVSDMDDRSRNTVGGESMNLDARRSKETGDDQEILSNITEERSKNNNDTRNVSHLEVPTIDVGNETRPNTTLEITNEQMNENQKGELELSQDNDDQVRAPILDEIIPQDVDTIPPPEIAETIEPIANGANVTDEQQLQQGIIPDMEEIDVSRFRNQRKQPGDVLQSIQDNVNEIGATIFDEVCPPGPGGVNRFDAACTFMALLRLEQKNYVVCKQEECYDPIEIHLKNQDNPYYTESGSNSE